MSRIGVARAALLIVVVAGGLASCRRAPEPGGPLIRLFGMPASFSVALADHYNTTIPGVRVVPQTTASSLWVVSALQRGDGEVGAAQGDAVYLAYRRGTEQDPHPHTNLRGIAVLWEYSAYIMVRRDGGLRSIDDLRGKRVGIPPLSASELFARVLLKGYGLGYDDMRPAFRPLNELLRQLIDETLDAVIVFLPALPDIFSGPDRAATIRLLPISADVAAQLRAEYPFVRPVAVHSAAVAGRRDEVTTLAVRGLLVCRKDLGEDLVYHLTKELFAALPQLTRASELAAFIDPDEGPTMPIPLHPGAARYYREHEITQ